MTVRRDAGLYGYERALRRAGIEAVAGVDEAGRGACAGPLVAGAVVLLPGKAGIVPGLADSKLLTEAARERVYAQVLRRAVAWSVVVIEQRGVRPARHARRQRRGTAPCGRAAAGATVVRPHRRLPGRRPGRPGACGLEGRPGRGLHRRGVGGREGHPRPADGRLDASWPAYDFKTHKGYVTEAHEAALAEHGPCPLHRMRFVNVAAPRVSSRRLDPATSVGPEHVDPHDEEDA